MKIDLRDFPTSYINMDQHKERKADMIQLGLDVGFKDYSRVKGVSMPKQPMSGCARSHQSILDSMEKPSIILEDDCVIRNDTYVIEIPDNTDALYLGLSAWGFMDGTSRPNNFKYEKQPEFQGIYKIEGMLATHAILYISKDYIEISRRVAKWSAENNKHIDQGFALIQKYYNVYALKKPIFYQHSNTESTNIMLRGKNG